MKTFNWNADKNQQLMTERGLSFEAVLFSIQNGHLLDDIEHPNDGRYPGQRILVVDIDGYICLVPYVENSEEIFLKTIIPSRKATRQYRGENP